MSPVTKDAPTESAGASSDHDRVEDRIENTRLTPNPGSKAASLECSVRAFEGEAIHDNPEVFKCPECGMGREITP